MFLLLFLLCDWLQEVIVGIFVFWASCDPVSCSCCYYAGVRVLTMCPESLSYYHQNEQHISRGVSHIIHHREWSNVLIVKSLFLPYRHHSMLSVFCLDHLYIYWGSSKAYLHQVFMLPWPFTPQAHDRRQRGQWPLTSRSGKSLRSDDKEGSREPSVSVLHVLWFRHERE